jgi:hypothetical protein
MRSKQKFFREREYNDEHRQVFFPGRKVRGREQTDFSENGNGIGARR